MAGSQSQFDHDELAKITHRGLQPLSKRTGQRLQQENVEGLKTAERNENQASVFFFRLLDRFKGLLSLNLGDYMNSKKAHTMCKEYGHVISPGWTGAYPKCDQCGAEVRDPTELRKAIPTKEKNDNPTDSGRRYVK
jgi:hypothetical protein